MANIEIGSSVTTTNGNFSGFVAHLFDVNGATWARVVTFAEDNASNFPVQFLDLIS